jgi:hypothetical protein
MTFRSLGDWSPDGKIVVFSHVPSSGADDCIFDVGRRNIEWFDEYLGAPK